MTKCLFSSKTILALIVAGAVAAVPASSAAAATKSTTIFTSLQGTSLLGHTVPVVGTQGYNVTLPVSSSLVPQAVWNAIDITADVNVSLGSLQVVNLDVDPHLAK